VQAAILAPHHGVPGIASATSGRSGVPVPLLKNHNKNSYFLISFGRGSVMEGLPSRSVKCRVDRPKPLSRQNDNVDIIVDLHGTFDECDDVR
jgi:hypothetical protein